MARTFWTTLSLALALQCAALGGYVTFSMHNQASVVSATLYHTAKPGDVTLR